MDTYQLIALSITILLAVIGWIVAILLQGHNIKHQLKVQVRYDIYKQLVDLHQSTQNSISKLGALSSPPLISMRASMIPFKVGLKKQCQGVWIPYQEGECVFEGEQKWNDFVHQLYKLYFDFSNKALRMHYLAEDWISAFKPLVPTLAVLFAIIEKSKKQIYSQLEILQNYSRNNGNDWRNWNESDVTTITQKIVNETFSLGAYMQDFMVLVHNELIAPYFRFKRLTRMTLDPQFKVLTKDGLVENVDQERVKKIHEQTNLVTSYARDQLQQLASSGAIIASDYEKYLCSLSESRCPTCNSALQVLEFEGNENGFSFLFLCGHSLKGITLAETVKLKNLLKIVQCREGLGVIRKIVQGWKPSFSPKLKHGVDVFMNVDVEKNQYDHIVADHVMHEVTHEEHEPLDQHKTK